MGGEITHKRATRKEFTSGTLWEAVERSGEKMQVRHDGFYERGVRDGLSDLNEEIQLGWNCWTLQSPTFCSVYVRTL